MRLKRAGPIAAALVAAFVLVPSASSGNHDDDNHSRQVPPWEAHLVHAGRDPFDGDFRARVTAPGSGADGVKILSGDGRTLLATGSWNGSRGKSAEYRVCGARSVKVRVIRAVAAARFTLQVQVP